MNLTFKPSFIHHKVQSNGSIICALCQHRYDVLQDRTKPPQPLLDWKRTEVERYTKEIPEMIAQTQKYHPNSSKQINFPGWNQIQQFGEASTRFRRD